MTEVLTPTKIWNSDGYEIPIEECLKDEDGELLWEFIGEYNGYRCYQNKAKLKELLNPLSDISFNYQSNLGDTYAQDNLLWNSASFSCPIWMQST